MNSSLTATDCDRVKKGLALCILFTAISCRPPLDISACQSHDDCPPPFRCDAELAVCVAAGSGDATTGPGDASRDAAPLDRPARDTVQPDSAAADVYIPESGPGDVADASTPDVTVGELGAQDRPSNEASSADAEAPDGSQADAGSVDTWTADTQVQDSAGPDAAFFQHCEQAVSLESTSGEIDVDLRGLDNQLDPNSITGCHSAPGPERVFSILIDAGSILELTATASQGDPVLYVMDACPSQGGACLLWFDSSSGSTEHIRVVAYGAAIDALLVVDLGNVDSQDSWVHLSGTQHSLVSGDICAQPRPLLQSSGHDLLDLSAHTNQSNPQTVSSCGPAAGPDIFYEIELPAQHRLQATLTVENSNETLYLMDACPTTGGECLAWSDDSTWSTERLEFFNYDPERSVLLVADSQGPSNSGPGQLDWSALPIADGNTCDAPVFLLGGGETRVDSLTAADGLLDAATLTGCGITSAGPELVYAVQVASGQHLHAQMNNNSSSGVNEVLYLLDSCSPAANCLEASDGSSWAAERIEYSNYSADREVYVIADSLDWGAPGDAFVLEWSVQDLPAGNRCPDAKVLTGDSGQELGSLSAADNNIDTGLLADCPRYVGGPDVVYEIVVPADHHLRAELTNNSSGGIDEVLYLLDQCNPATALCVASGDASTRAPERIEWSNPGQTRSYFLVVDGADWEVAGGAYELDWSVRALPAHNSCAAPEVLATGSSQTLSDSLIAADNRFDPSQIKGCALTGDGPDLVYRVDIPVGYSLSVTYDNGGSGGLDEVLYLLDSCLASDQSCVQTSDDSTWAAETLTYANISGTSDHFLIVDSKHWNAVGGTFDLNWAVTPL